MGSLCLEGVQEGGSRREIKLRFRGNSKTERNRKEEGKDKDLEKSGTKTYRKVKNKKTAAEKNDCDRR